MRSWSRAKRMISPLLAPLRMPLNALKESTRQMARFMPNAAVQMKSASAAPRESSTSLPNCDRWDDAFRSRKYLAGPPVLWRRDQPLVEMRRDTHPLFEPLRGEMQTPNFFPKSAERQAPGHGTWFDTLSLEPRQKFKGNSLRGSPASNA